MYYLEVGEIWIIVIFFFCRCLDCGDLSGGGLLGIGRVDNYRKLIFVIINKFRVLCLGEF